MAPYTGDRGDIAGQDRVQGRRAHERVLAEARDGQRDHVQFSDLKKEYAFGVAVFDNAQVRHAYSPGVLKMKFE